MKTKPLYELPTTPEVATMSVTADSPEFFSTYTLVINQSECIPYMLYFVLYLTGIRHLTCQRILINGYIILHCMDGP